MMRGFYLGIDKSGIYHIIMVEVKECEPVCIVWVRCVTESGGREMATINQTVKLFDDGFSVNFHNLRANPLNHVTGTVNVSETRANVSPSLSSNLNNVQNPYKNYSEYLQEYAEEKSEFESGLKGVTGQLNDAVEDTNRRVGQDSILRDLRDSTMELEKRRAIAKEAAKDVAESEEKKARLAAMESEREQAAEQRKAEMEQRAAIQAAKIEEQEEMAAERDRVAEERRAAEAESEQEAESAERAVADENMSAVLQSVQQLVQGYNEAADFLNGKRDVSGKVSALADSFTRQGDDDLSQRLAQVGIDVDDSGRLSVNMDKLASTLQDNPNMVESLIGSDGLSGRASTQVKRIGFQTDRLFPGPESKLNDERIAGSKQLYTAPSKANAHNPFKSGNFFDMSY